MECKDGSYRPQWASQRSYPSKATETPKTYCLKHVGLVHLKCLRCRLSKLKCDFICLVENQMEQLSNNWDTDMSTRLPIACSTPIGSNVCFALRSEEPKLSFPPPPLTPQPRFHPPLTPHDTFSSPRLKPPPLPPENPNKNNSTLLFSHAKFDTPNDTFSSPQLKTPPPPPKEPEKEIVTTSVSHSAQQVTLQSDDTEAPSVPSVQFPSSETSSSVASVKSNESNVHPQTPPPQLLLMPPLSVSPPEPLVLPVDIPSSSRHSFKNLSSKSEIISPPNNPRVKSRTSLNETSSEPSVEHIEEPPPTPRRPSNLIQPGERRSYVKKSVRIAETPAIELEEESSPELTDALRSRSEDVRSNRSNPRNSESLSRARSTSARSAQTLPLASSSCTMDLLKNLLRVFLFFVLVYLLTLIAVNAGFMLFQAFQDKCSCWQQHKKIIF